MVLVFPEILVHIQVNVSSQSLSLVAAHWMVQGNFGPGCLHLQDSDVISLGCNLTILELLRPPL